jgi:cobalt/nickel transport system permease protein
MDIWLDRYASGQSPIHRWEARCRFVGLFSLIVACALVNQLVLLPGALAVAAGCYLAARLPLSFLLTRLRYPGALLLVAVLLLPFISGQTALAQLGPLTLYQEGLAQAVVMAARFGCILTISLVLFGTAPMLTTVHTLRALGVPGLLVDLLLLCYRYLADTAARLTAMQRALRLRGFAARRLDGRLLHTLAALLGSLLVQSHARSERIYQAMRLRGYGQAPPAARTTPVQAADWLGLAVALALAALLGGTALLLG